MSTVLAGPEGGEEGILESVASQVFFGEAEVMADFVDDRSGDLFFHFPPPAEGFFKTLPIELDARGLLFDVENGPLVIGDAQKDAEHPIPPIPVLKHAGRFSPGDQPDAFVFKDFPEPRRHFFDGGFDDILELGHFHRRRL